MKAKKQVLRFGPFKDFIANGVKIGGALYLSGQVSLDEVGKVVGKGDLGAQVKQSYANVEDVLANFDATMDNIVDETWFVTDMAVVMVNIKELLKIGAVAYGGQPDVTQTLVQVAGLNQKYLLHNAIDANEVDILFEAVDLDRAKAFAESAELRQKMQKVGVIDKPDIYFLKD